MNCQLVPKVIKEIATAKSTHPYYSYYHTIIIEKWIENEFCMFLMAFGIPNLITCITKSPTVAIKCEILYDKNSKNVL